MLAEQLALVFLSGALMLGFYQFIRGADLLNRIIAFDLLSICIIGIMVVFSEQALSPHYMEILVVFCLLGFTTAVVFVDGLFRTLSGK